jgi:hypothetical protein
MKKTLISMIALAFAFAFGVTHAAEAPAKTAAPAKTEAKKEVCKDKAGKEVPCPKKEEKKKK